MKLQWTACLLLLGILILPAVGHAETSCPWLNRATAAGVLGGPVSLTLQSTAADGATCLFQYQKETTVYDLQIVVHPIDPSAKDAMPAAPRCLSRATSLRGVGNESTMCAVDFNALHGERVAGRVRDKNFVVRLGTSMKNDPAMTGEMMRTKIENVAEQVAGSLF